MKQRYISLFLLYTHFSIPIVKCYYSDVKPEGSQSILCNAQFGLQMRVYPSHERCGVFHHLSSSVCVHFHGLRRLALTGHLCCSCCSALASTWGSTISFACSWLNDSLEHTIQIRLDVIHEPCRGTVPICRQGNRE